MASVAEEDAAAARSFRNKGGDDTPRITSQSFEAELRRVYTAFVNEITDKCRELAHHQIESITSGGVKYGGSAMGYNIQSMLGRDEPSSPSLSYAEEEVHSHP